MFEGRNPNYLQLACEIELILLFSLLTRTNWSSLEAVSSWFGWFRLLMKKG